MGERTLIEHINSFLPVDIHIWQITRVQSSFNPRTFCDSRMYDYCVPTYVFLPPKPGTAMAETLKTAREASSVKLEHTSADDFWSDFMATLPDSLVKPPVEAATNGSQAAQKEADYLASDYFKHEMQAKNAFRLPKELLEALKKAANEYVGPHNFHNFTVGKDFKDRSAQRHMKSLTVRWLYSDQYKADSRSGMSYRYRILSLWASVNGCLSRYMVNPLCCIKS